MANLLEPLLLGDTGVGRDARRQRVLGECGDELVAGAAALGRPLVAIAAKTGDLANGGASRHRTREQMRIQIPEQMGLVGSHQSRRRTFLDAMSEQDGIFSLAIELIALELVCTDGKIPRT